MSEYYEDDFEASGTGGPAGKGNNISQMIIKEHTAGGNTSNMLLPANIGQNKVKFLKSTYSKLYRKVELVAECS